MTQDVNEQTFTFLKDLALELGASEARIISTKDVVVEHRVVLKCKTGCDKYGKTLMCPPYSPAVDEFKKALNEYSYVLVFKIKSKAPPEIAKLLAKDPNDPTLTTENKQQIQQFWDSWKADKKSLINKVVKLEKTAMKKGYTLALGFTTGSCMICDTCNTKEKICTHPTEARYSAQSVGINVMQTLQNAGIPIPYPFQDTPETFGLILIT